MRPDGAGGFQDSAERGGVGERGGCPNLFANHAKEFLNGSESGPYQVWAGNG